MANVAIVGAGMMGTATAFPLTDNGHSVRLVGTHLDGEIIRSCKERHYHPRLKRELPRGVRPYYVEEVAPVKAAKPVKESVPRTTGFKQSMTRGKLFMGV